MLAEQAMGVRRITRQAAKTSIVLGERAVPRPRWLGRMLSPSPSGVLSPSDLGLCQTALDASLGLRAVGLDQLDVQFSEGSAKLRFALVIGLAFFVRS